MTQVSSQPVDSSAEYLNAACACTGAAASVLGRVVPDSLDDARTVAFDHLTEALDQLRSARADVNADMGTVLYKARRAVQAAAVERAALAAEGLSGFDGTVHRADFEVWAAVHLLTRAARSLLKAAGPTDERRKGEESDGLLAYVLQEPNAHRVALIRSRLLCSDVEAVEEAALFADYDRE